MLKLDYKNKNTNKKNTMRETEDILASLEQEDTSQNSTTNESITLEDKITFEEYSLWENKNSTEFFPQEVSKEEIILASNKKNILWGIIFFIKYTFSSLGIFVVLLLLSNYSAYWNLAASFIYADDLETSKNWLIQSVAASNISEEKKSTSEVDTFKQVWNISGSQTGLHDINTFVAQSNNTPIDLGIEITPYENRIVIPKIGKNIPLLDITQTRVEDQKELDDIFMKELQNGVIRYPGSAKPGEEGNSFIFGHSSNFPWVEGKFNDVFALLDRVVYDDEVIVYYGQEKYIYKISSKNVIRPGDVSVLKQKKDDRKQITLMTCWPIGTTLNRLVLTGELVEIQK